MNKLSEIDTLVFCAFRYALGRCTYIVQDVADIIIKYKDHLHEHTKRGIKADIAYAIDNCEAGMQMDIDLWRRVYASI